MNLEKQIKNKDMRINIMQKEIERLKKENENLKNELNVQVTIPKEKYNIAIKECEKTKEEYLLLSYEAKKIKIECEKTYKELKALKAEYAKRMNRFFAKIEKVTNCIN